MKLTKKARTALAWMAENGPIKMFAVAGPCTITMAKSLESKGLLAKTSPKSGFGLVEYSITEPGRKALTGDLVEESV